KGEHIDFAAARKGVFGYLDRFFIGFNRRFDRTANRYQNTVAGVAKRPRRGLIVYALIAIVMAFLFLRLPTSFLPPEDQGAVRLQVTLPAVATDARLQPI